MTELRELIFNLKYYQMWRRGIDDRIPMPNPKDISMWIYQAIEELEKIEDKNNDSDCD